MANIVLFSTFPTLKIERYQNIKESLQFFKKKKFKASFGKVF